MRNVPGVPSASRWLIAVIVIVASGCGYTTLSARDSLEYPPDRSLTSTPGMARYYEEMNVYSEAQRVAETRAADLRRIDRNRTLVSSLISAAGALASGLLQLAFNDADQAAEQNWGTGIGLIVAFGGAIVTSGFAVFGSSEDAAALDQAAGTLRATLTDAAALEQELPGLSLELQRGAVATRLQTLRKQGAPARAQVVRQFPTLISLEGAVRTLTRREMGTVSALTMGQYFEQRRLEQLAGYEPLGERFQGNLTQGQQRSVSVTLEAGRCYAVLAVAEIFPDRINDLDLAVFDPAPAQIAEDTALDGWPLVQFCAPVGGEHKVRFTMVTGSGGYLGQLFVHGRQRLLPPQ